MQNKITGNPVRRENDIIHDCRCKSPSFSVQISYDLFSPMFHLFFTSLFFFTFHKSSFFSVHVFSFFFVCFFFLLEMPCYLSQFFSVSLSEQTDREKSQDRKQRPLPNINPVTPVLIIRDIRPRDQYGE